MSYTAILTAANPQNNLVYLKEEFQDLNTHFQSAPIVNAVINLNGTEEAVFNAFLRKTDIRIFHFSGHAGDGNLLMDDGRLSHGNILAAMMRHAKYLNLVFLNGCATYELVDKFFEYGAKLVIATKTPVFEHVASRFSSRFYFALCTLKYTIGQSFDYAKNNKDTKDSLQQRLAEVNGETDSGAEQYKNMLHSFAGDELARNISRPNRNMNEAFQWGIYHKDESTPAQREEQEGWMLTDPTPVQPLEHQAPSFDFLKRLAGAVSEMRGQLPQNPADPHLAAFIEIETLAPQADYWGAKATSTIAKKLNETLLLPLKEPFDQLINHSRDKQEELFASDIAETGTLLQYQLKLYEAFIRTSAMIMLSDFMESTMRVGFSQDEEAKKIFRDSINKTQDLFRLFNQIINEEKDFSDLEFAIYVMRSIVSFLQEARKNAAGELTMMFQQFVKEYNGNEFGSNIQKALQNSIHETLLDIYRKSKNGELQQASKEVLRCYCDRVETALIELFMINKYVLMYEIITVGKVEANKRRDSLLRTINHDIFDDEGLLPPSFIKYEEGFAENYSVILVSHKTVFQVYLSLSPFIINVGPYLEEDKAIFYAFNKKSKKWIEYAGFNHDFGSVLRMNIQNEPGIINNPADNSFLELSDLVSIMYARRTDKLKLRARTRFAIVRDQFRILEEHFLNLCSST